jgi:hypothetical protein
MIKTKGDNMKKYNITQKNYFYAIGPFYAKSKKALKEELKKEGIGFNSIYEVK